MDAYQERVIEEKKELDIKRDKLVEFLKSDKFTTLSGRNQELLERQDYIMGEYQDILAQRIALFE